MKYYSETLKSLFESKEECEEAELKAKKAKEEAEKKSKALKEQRKERAAEVEKALEELSNAEKNYKELLSKFITDYGSFHYTYSFKNDNLDLNSLYSFTYPFFFL